MGVSLGLRFGKGDVELETLGGVLPGVDLGPTIQAAHSPILGVRDQEPHAHPPLSERFVHSA